MTEPSTLRWSARRHLAVALALALVAALLVLPAPVPAAADADDGPPTTETVVGPYAVGLTTVEVDVPHRDDPLPVDVWYPADADAAAGADPAEYTLVVELGDLSLPLAIPSPLALDEPAVAGGDHPLVVFSHGNGGVRFQSGFLTEALASFGFVVVSPDHLGNTFSDLLGPDATPFEVVAGERPRDVSALIDAAIDGAIAPELLGDVVDTDRIAVSGHSFGGYTALAAAGGAPVAEFDGDDRIDAIVPLAPSVSSTLLPDETLAAMTVPTLFIGGTLDSTTPIAPNIGRAVDLMASETLYQLDLEDAGHFTFSDVCGFAEAIEAQLGSQADLFLPQLPGYPETCDGSRLPVEEAHPAIIRATAGFLLDELDVPPPGAPEPPYATDRVGDFAVGKTTVAVDVPHRDADLPVEIWYPADATSAADAEAAEYTLRVPLGDGEFVLRQDSPLSRDEPTVADGRFPLVVFSHGSGGVRFQSLFLGEELASHGFVVIAPDHLGNTFADGLDPDPTADPARDRPRDVSALLDAAEANGLSPLLGDHVDTGRVAVAGHSFGGYTALAAAGGNPTVDYDPDPRVDAIVPIAPATRATLLSDEVLAGIDVPALFIGGTADDVTPIVPNVTRPQALMASDPLYRVDVEDAGHYSFSNVCDFAAAISDQLGAAAGFVLSILPGYPESCDGTLRDIDEVLDITSLATTGFLQTYLGGPAVTDPTDPTDPDPTDPDPTDPDPTDPDPTDPDPTDPGPTDPGPPLVDFPDVPVGNVHRDAILELARDGILRGGLDGRFRPAQPITRGQVAAVLARTAGLDPVTPSRFPDVAGSVHAGDIEALAATGIVEGYADGTFRPLEPIRRDHVAALVARWLGVGPVASGPFGDIDRTPHAGSINALAELGVLRGRTADTFAPDLDIRRDQFASVVSRARAVTD